MTHNSNTIIYAWLRFCKGLIFALLLLSGFRSFGQNDYPIFRYHEPFQPDSTGKFYFALDNVNFFKNNEYKGEIATGYTLTGAWLRPKVVYYPDAKLRMEFGGQVLKYNGREKIDHLSPWFNVQYVPTDKISLILGNLNADQNHQLPEFLADPELFLIAKPEAGLQAKYNSKRFSADLWIDWQQFILEGDPFKERFAFGAVASYQIVQKNNLSLSVPLIFYGLHEGGEIDTAPGLAKSSITVTTGLAFKKTISDNLFKGWGLKANYSLSTYPKDNLIPEVSKGWGAYINGNIDTRLGGLTLAYWHGHQYYTPQGAVLYQNLSNTGTAMIPENKLINLKYHFFHEIMPSTYFGFVFDYYYDTINRQTMNSEGLYLIVNFEVLTRHRK